MTPSLSVHPAESATASPNRKAIVAWVLLIVWVGFIYATLSVVPLWRKYLADRYGEGVYAVITYTGASLAAALFLAFMIFRNREKRILPYLILIGILLFLRHILRHWIIIPVEQIHFIEYGLVGFLAYNALRHRLRGWGVITAALLLTYFFGMVDECIQGALANRVGQQLDMFWNVLAGGLALAMVSFSLRPGILMQSSNLTEIRTLLIILALSLPVQGYFDSTFAQFGVLIKDDTLGSVFRSRLRPDDLRRYNDNLDHFRHVIAPRIGLDPMDDLLTRVHDKIHEEALVHSFRRQMRYLAGDFTTAYKEDLILNKYYPQFLQGSGLNWPEERVGQLQSMAGDLALNTYYSPVADHLITRFTEAQMWVVIALSEIVLILSLVRMRLSANNKKADASRHSGPEGGLCPLSGI